MLLRLMPAWAPHFQGTRHLNRHIKRLRIVLKALNTILMTRADGYVCSQNAHTSLCPFDAYMGIHTFPQGLRRRYPICSMQNISRAKSV
jgi:hypothetical protein